MDINGNPTNSIFTNLIASKLEDITQSVSVNLSHDTINLVASSVLVNGLPIGGIENPLTGDLSIGAYDVVGLPNSQTLKSITTKVLDTEAKTVNIISAAFPTTTTMQGILRTDQVATDKVSSLLESDYIDLSTGAISIITQSLTLNGNPIVSTPYASPLEAGSFVKTGGTNIQYLMGDGSVLTQSANSGNSNFYLFDSSTTQDTTPPLGDITYNNAVQASATIIYISHVTRDGIDIEVFFKQLSTLTDVYIQDQSTSVNYIQYNITGTPTIIAEAQVAIPVVLRIGAGTGLTNFPNGHNVLLSFFQNAIETDTRISAVESKSQNITAISGTTTFSGSIVKSGGTVDDILLANGSTTTLVNSTVYTSLQNEAVPRGARDYWNDATGSTGTGLVLVGGIIFSFASDTKMSYSTNGGTTFSNCIGLPTLVLYNMPAYNPFTGVYLVTGGSLATSILYRSTDGITWVNIPSFPIIYTPVAFGFIYFNGYFILPVSGSTNVITSSNDGSSWVAQTCPNPIYSLEIGLDLLGTPILVSAGTGTNYTYDGITWVSSSAINGRAIAYSSTRKEFVAYSNTVFQFYRSVDGKNWVSLSATITPNYFLNATLKWVGSDVNGIPINMYYFPTTTDGRYSLVYSPNCKSGTLRTTQMLGATANTGNLHYGFLYSLIYDRFLLSTNTPTFIKYANNTTSMASNGNFSVNGSLVLNKVSLIDVASLDRPFIGVQYIHTSTGTPNATIYTSPYTTAGGSSISNAPYAITNNFTRQLGCANWTTGTFGDGQATGLLSTSGTGAQVCRGFSFGLIAILGISDTAYNANNCQNFFGLWNLATAVPLTQAAQLSTRLNFIAFGSDTNDANICIYTAGATFTIKQVDLGSSFPANRPAGSASTDWYKLALWWDTDAITMYYKAVNTTLGVTVQGSFVQTGNERMPASSISLYPQCLRIQGSPQTSGQGKLQVQKFGVF